MTEIKKSLSRSNATTTAVVAVRLDFTHRQKLVALRLEGTILSEHTAALRDFLQNVGYFPGNKWTLQLENLDVISMRGLQVLAKFARVIRRRGAEIEITNINPAILATFADTGFQKLFNWNALPRQSRFNMLALSPRTVRPKMTFQRLDLIEEFETAN